VRAAQAWIFAAVVAASASPAQEVLRVTVSGNVDRPGEISFQGEPRLSDAVTTAQVNRNAFVLGAAWLRPGLIEQQTRLKAGLLFQLGWIDKSAAAKRRREPLSSLARRLHGWIEAMPVTGRKIVRTLEPHALQVDPADNLLVADGDRLVYPSRPDAVNVVGAVEQDCRLPLAALQDVRAYVVRCARSRFADPDWVWVIQPDGNVSEVGIALWNRSPAMPVAPGAFLYVPIEPDAIERDADEEFNRDMANFLATQPVGGSGASP
jgi:hypothetical protein